MIEPHLRFAGQPGEQWTMFFRDPSGARPGCLRSRGAGGRGKQGIKAMQACSGATICQPWRGRLGVEGLGSRPDRTVLLCSLWCAAGNALEFKAMTNPGNLFAKYRVN